MRPTILLALAVLFLAGCASTPSGPLTAYEGARLIVGDGRVVENATLVVDGSKIIQAGAAADGVACPPARRG